MTNPDRPSRFPRELLNFRFGKWDLVVITSLAGGKMRFNELKSEIGEISQKMLTSTLKELERDGFITRTQYPSIPPRVEYDLTELGHEMRVHAETWITFARVHRVAVLEARKAFDEEHGTALEDRKLA